MRAWFLRTRRLREAKILTSCSRRAAARRQLVSSRNIGALSAKRLEAALVRFGVRRLRKCGGLQKRLGGPPGRFYDRFVRWQCRWLSDRPSAKAREAAP